MRQSFAVAALSLAGSCVAGDVLSSSRMQKREIDSDGNFNMTFFHVNDVHAHLDEYTSRGQDCDDPEDGCFGGYARIKTAIETIRPQYEDSLWLNAGDEFQGTLYWIYYQNEKIQEVVNDLGFDAMTLGNHEFDAGDDVLGDFVKNVTVPIISANIQSTNTKLNETIIPYIIFEEQQVAVIGVTTVTTPTISSPGEGTSFLPVIDSVQAAIDEIKATTDITRIVALTHIGYEEDVKLAEGTTGLSLIMGGHSHTLLGDMEDAEGDYPTVATDLDDNEVFVVTAYRWGEYIGQISVTWDDEGHALEYYGAPVHMTNATSQDETLQAQVEEWAEPFEAFSSEVVGVSEVELVQETCQDGDCLLGQFMADAMLVYRQNLTEEGDAQPDFALINAGGIRAGIDEGNITRGEVLTSFPFGNAIVELEYTGAEVKEIIEGCVSLWNVINDEEITSWFQVSQNIEIQYNPDNNNGSKLVSLMVGGEAVEDEQDYRVVTLDFLAGGGDNIFPATSDFVTLDLQDVVLVEYIEAMSPVDVELEDRVVATTSTGTDDEETTDEEEASATESAAADVVAGSMAVATGVNSLAGLAVAAVAAFALL